jgi:hypothetical protein
MPTKALDLVGKVVGRLTVIERVAAPAGKSKKSGAFWRCQCACGNEHIALASALSSGNTRSCGCRRIDRKSD